MTMWKCKPLSEVSRHELFEMIRWALREKGPSSLLVIVEAQGELMRRYPGEDFSGRANAMLKEEGL